MFSIYKKELQSFFYTPFAYALTALFMLLFTYIFANKIGSLESGNTVLVPFVSIFYDVIFFFMFLIPLITMRTFADERKFGTEVLLMTSPVSVFKIVMGKFFANITVFLFMLAGTAIFPIVTQHYAGEGGGVIASQLICAYIGFFFWGAMFITLGMLISSFTESSIIAAIIGELVMFVFLFLDDFAYTAFIEQYPKLQSVLIAFAAQSRFHYFSQGVIRRSDLIFFVSAIIVLLSWTYISIEKKTLEEGVSFDGKEKEAINLDKAKKKKINLSGPIAFVMAFLVLLVFVPVNLIVSYYDDFYDMTPNKKYTLDPVTVKLVEDNKDKDIEIYFLAELRGLKEDPSTLPLYHTLTRLDAYDNIKLISFEPDDDPTLAQSLDPTGIHGISRADIFVKCGDVIKKVNKYMLFQNYDEENRTSDYSGEEQIANAIKIVTNGSLPTVYFLTGHGEKSIEDSYLEYANHLKANTYDVKELDLDKAGAIPSNAEIVCLAGPKSDITDKERELLEGYLSDPINPGSVSFFMSPCDTEGTFDNIESILYDYGLTMDYNLVKETNTINMLNDRKNQQLPEFMRIHYMLPSEDLKVDLTTDVITLCNEGGLTAGISNTRSVGRIDDDKFPEYEQFERASLIENIPETTESADGMASNVTYSTESSAMGGNKNTAAQAERLTGQQLAYAYYSHNKKNNSKVVLFGSTDMIDGDMLSDSVSATNMLALFSNTWLYDTEVSAGVNVKKEAIDKMTFKDAKEATTAIAVTVIVPICVAVFGVVVWLRRRHA